VRPDPARPLAGWTFDGTLRAYQAAALRRVDVDAGEPLHLVAPPGSGKTLVGLLLAARRGKKTVVFAPTLAIRDQWVTAARALAHDDAAVSGDPTAPADLTALTYQSISVLDSVSPFAGLARSRWLEELEADDRSPDAATAWLDALAESNPAAYRRGIRARARAVRRTLSRQDATVLAAALHPNARDLIDRLVAEGVETIVLDECHHLLDHWALVVAALIARLRAAGREPLVIGLTATLPTPDDADEYDNYLIPARRGRSRGACAGGGSRGRPRPVSRAHPRRRAHRRGAAVPERPRRGSRGRPAHELRRRFRTRESARHPATGGRRRGRR
jgi:hypothetical protein